MRPLIGVSVVICFVGCVLVATLYLLQRLRLTGLRLLVAIFAGLLTDYLVRVIIFLGDSFVARWAELAAWGYRDLFGVRSAAVRIFYPEYYFPSPDSVLPDHPQVELVADLVPIALWTCIFAVLYLMRVPRAPQRSNQAMQRTAGRSAF